ncbi:MAG: phosphoserine transaminase [Proteobacteria bacterium]|nr:phosphoserine transaminase [Pseudomonadota bacterium]
MNTVAKPATRPANPNFSSGPCAKRPGWTPLVLADAVLGRSHRSKLGKDRINDVMDRSRAMLGLPDDYRIAVVAASDTGAMEMAMWSLLGARGVDIFAWESFGSGWVTDVAKQLKLEDVRVLEADYGDLPDLGQADFSRDVIFTWNGTTSGVRVPNGDWIADDREGLVIADATSAVFAMDIPWSKIDVATYSWQKVMGGEAQHGVLILSPRAIERLESYSPPWPMPKLFRLTSGGKFSESIFQGSTINTPSMLCVEDALDGLKWGESIGGLKSLIQRSERNLSTLARWVESSPNVEFLAHDPATRSNTSVCFKIVAPWFTELDDDQQAAVTKRVSAILDDEGVAYDIDGYRDAPPGLRIWAGATIEASDLDALTQWIDWAIELAKSEFTVQV